MKRSVGDNIRILEIQLEEKSSTVLFKGAIRLQRLMSILSIRLL
jgi:hypothetical protein